MLSPEQVVDASFLEARHMLLEIAALLDRYDAAVARGAEAGSPVATAKLAALRQALGVLREPAPPQDRTVALLELFAHV